MLPLMSLGIKASLSSLLPVKVYARQVKAFRIQTSQGFNRKIYSLLTKARYNSRKYLRQENLPNDRPSQDPKKWP